MSHHTRLHLTHLKLLTYRDLNLPVSILEPRFVYLYKLRYYFPISFFVVFLNEKRRIEPKDYCSMYKNCSRIVGGLDLPFMFSTLNSLCESFGRTWVKKKRPLKVELVRFRLFIRTFVVFDLKNYTSDRWILLKCTFIT